MLDCRDCKPKYDAKNCGGKEWYQPSDIKFCTFQNMWLIRLLPILKEGYWPMAGENLDYIDWEEAGNVSDAMIRHKGVKHDAYFVNRSLIKAELELRLKKTGADGEVLEAQVEAGREFGDLSYRAKTALFYISGGRKRKKYSQWKATRKYKEGK